VGQRRESREIALQVLFQREFAPDIQIEDALNLFRSSFEAEREVWNYATLLLRGVATHKEGIDEAIQAASAHWSLKRMALTDLNIMRIATFELLFSEDPPPPLAVIDEAIEISKKYGTNDSASFTNGILDQIRKTRP
jgi:N utilization substance protein B